MVVPFLIYVHHTHPKYANIRFTCPLQINLAWSHVNYLKCYQKHPFPLHRITIFQFWFLIRQFSKGYFLEKRFFKELLAFHSLKHVRGFIFENMTSSLPIYVSCD